MTPDPKDADDGPARPVDPTPKATPKSPWPPAGAEKRPLTLEGKLVKAKLLQMVLEAKGLG